MKNTFLIFLILYFTSVGCIIEIPLKSIEVKDVIKYKDIKIKEVEDSIENNEFNQISLIDEGSTIISPSRLFLASIKVSQNDQPFNLVLDTGSAYLWVPQKGSNDKSKTISHHFEPTSSSSNTGASFKMVYGTGSCSGSFFLDYIKYINNKSFQFVFGVATQTDFSVDGADGIIGLANYYDDKSKSLIYRLYEEKITNSKQFSFKFGENINTGQTGKLFIGKHEDFSSSDTVKCPLIYSKTKPALNSFWTCKLSKFGLKNSNNVIKISNDIATDVIFDTGTNVIILPIAYLEDIKEDLKDFECEDYLEKDSYQLKCKNNAKTLPDFRFEINGNVLTIPYEYSFYNVNNKYAYSRVIFKKYDIYIIGSPFFFAFHTLFDQDAGNLYFHPENKKYLDIGSESSFTASDIAAIVVVIIVILLVAYIIYYIIKWKRSKKALEDAIPQSDYVFYNN